MLELALNRIEEVDGERRSTTIGIVQIDDSDPASTPTVLQPIDGHSLAVVLKVLNDFDAAAALARETWSS